MHHRAAGSTRLVRFNFIVRRIGNGSSALGAPTSFYGRCVTPGEPFKSFGLGHGCEETPKWWCAFGSTCASWTPAILGSVPCLCHLRLRLAAASNLVSNRLGSGMSTNKASCWRRLFVIQFFSAPPHWSTCWNADPRLCHLSSSLA